MNFGEEFSISQGKEFQFIGSWTPVTPQKPIPPGSNPIQMNEHGNQFGQENWQEFAGFPKGYFQDILNNNEVTQNFNQDRHFGSLNLPKNNRMINNIAGSYRQVLQNGSTEWRNHTWESLLTTGNATNGFASANQTASIGSRNTVSIPNLHSREDSWRHSSSHQSSSSDFISNINNFLQMPQYGFPIPSMPECNLNSPRTEVGADSRFTTSFQSMLAALNQSEKMENKQISTEPTSASHESSNCEERQENLIAHNENGVSRKNCKLLQNVVDSSSAVIATPMDEKDSERGSSRGIDLNKTPRQKPPKRRKHRPKVIVEGKPKSTPKSDTAADVNSKNNPSGKRKYVRKKGLVESATEHTNSTNEAGSTAGTPEKTKHVWNRSMKGSANKQIDSAHISARGAGITATGKHMHKGNQKESTTLQGDCTRGSDPSAQATQQVDCIKEPDPSSVPAQRSCRRVLDFDLENTGNGSSTDMLSHQAKLEGIKSFESPAMGFSDVGYSGFRTKFTPQTQQSRWAVENQQLQTEYSHPAFSNKMSMPGITAATATQLQAKEIMENVTVMARNVNNYNADLSQQRNINMHNADLSQQRNINMYNADLSQQSYGNVYASTQPAIQLVSQRRRNWENIHGTKELMFERRPQSVVTVLFNSNEGRGSKRDHYHAIEQGQFSRAGSLNSLLSQGIFEEDVGYTNCSSNGAAFLQASKRRMIEDETRAYIHGIKCPVSCCRTTSNERHEWC